MKSFTLLLSFVVLAAAACSTTVIAGGPGDGSSGASGSSGTSGSDGTPGVPDPDADDGTLWDGSLPSAPRLVSRQVTSSAVTTEDAIVYSTADGAVVVPAGGAPVTIATGAGQKVYRAGRAALAVGPSGAVTAWTKSSGVKRVEGMSVTLPKSDALVGYPTRSGNRVVVVQTANDTSRDLTKLGRWVLDLERLTATEVLAPVGVGRLAGCAVRDEAVTCASSRDGKTDLWTVDGGGARTRIVLPESAGDGVRQLGSDFMYVPTGRSLYRVPLANDDAPSAVRSAGHVVLEGGWLATMTDGLDAEVTLMRADGTGAKTVAKPAMIAPWISRSTLAFDTTRIRWLPICDLGSKGELTNLRVVDPAKGTTVPISSSCELEGITYSDNYAFAIDEWISTSGPIMRGTGKPIVVDLRDGSRRPNPTSQSYFGHTSIPIGKSRMLIHWLAYGQNRQATFYDAHTSPSTPAAAITTPTSSQGFVLFPSGKGVLLSKSTDTPDEWELYSMAW